MGARDWRKAEDYAGLAELDLSSLAWEFLRRNPQYRLEYAGLALGARELSPRWGLEFPVPPDLEAPDAPVFWRAAAAPAHVVPLVAAETGMSLGEVASLGVSRRRSHEGQYLRLGGGLQAWAQPNVTDATPLAAALPMDRWLAWRLGAAAALVRLLAGRPALAAPLTPLGRRRMVQMVRALDGRSSGASYQDVAVHILGYREGPSAWRTSTVRDVAIRLCRAARSLMGGGYRSLLLRRR